MYVHFFNFDHLRITLQSSDLFWGIKFCASSLLLPPFFFSYLQALIHSFLWWWASSWFIFSLKWCLQSFFFLLHSVAIKLQEAKDFINEKDPRPTSSTWSYIKERPINMSLKVLRGNIVLGWLMWLLMDHWWKFFQCLASSITRQLVSKSMVYLSDRWDE